MKLFEEQKPIERVVKQPIVVDSSTFIKNNLLKSVERSGEVYEGISSWLHSFEGAITKALFNKQLRKLSTDDGVALKQLVEAKGRRAISYAPVEKSVLEKPLIETMVEYTKVAICGKGFKKVLKQAVDELKSFGTVYVLSIEELILQFKSYKDKGNTPEIVDKAINCDFLFMVDLERPIHLERRIIETIERIGRFRKDKPIVSTWNKFNDCKEFFKPFKIFFVQ